MRTYFSIKSDIKKGTPLWGPFENHKSDFMRTYFSIKSDIKST